MALDFLGGSSWIVQSWFSEPCALGKDGHVLCPFLTRLCTVTLLDSVDLEAAFISVEMIFCLFLIQYGHRHRNLGRRFVLNILKRPWIPFYKIINSCPCLLMHDFEFFRIFPREYVLLQFKWLYFNLALLIWPNEADDS